MQSKKRFIAGAVCPNCNETDTMRMWLEDGISFRDCVVCGFTENNKKEQLAQKKLEKQKLNLIVTDARQSS